MSLQGIARLLLYHLFLQRYGLKARKSNCTPRLIVIHQHCFDAYPILTVRPLHGLKGKLLRRGDFPSLKLYDIYLSIVIRPVQFLAYHHYFQIRDIIYKYLN